MSLRGLFVTGTDTGVGKTAVASAIVHLLGRSEAHRAGVMKPVATGAHQTADGLISDDTATLRQALRFTAPVERVTPLVFEPPLAPPVAASLAGLPLTWEELWTHTADALDWWKSNQAEIVVVEGVGGVLCPLAEEATVADLAIKLDFPVLLLARRGLGTLNHTLLSVEALERRGVRIAGIILNQASPPVKDEYLAIETNAGELSRLLPRLRLIAELDYSPDPHSLSRALEGVDWWSLAEPPRHRQS